MKNESVKTYITNGNELYYWNQQDHAYDFVDFNKEMPTINSDFVTGGNVYSNGNKPEYSKMYKPKKKTKSGFDEMLISDKIRFMVDKIYLNGSHTCVVWKDGTKTVVNCADGDYYDEYAAFTAALAKKIYGNNTALKRMLEEKTVVQKPIPGKDWREPVYVKFDPESMSSAIHKACEKLHDALRGITPDEKKDDD